MSERSANAAENLADLDEVAREAGTLESHVQELSGRDSAAKMRLPLLEEGDVSDADDLGPESPGTRGRRRRRSHARARTISIRRLSKTELNLGKLLYPEEEYEKPRTRGECKDMPRPCPFVSCKYHLYIDVHPVRGSIKVNFPDVEVWEMQETCALDVADRGGITLEEVGEIMNLTRERVRQLETQGLAKLEGVRDVTSLKDYIG